MSRNVVRVVAREIMPDDGAFEKERELGSIMVDARGRRFGADFLSAHKLGKL